MTDSVEALAAAMRSCDGVNWPRRWFDAEHNFDWVARQVTAALRASGFDVVPTGEPAGSADAHLDEIRGRDARAQDPARTWAVDDRRYLLRRLDAIRAESTGTLDVERMRQVLNGMNLAPIAETIVRRYARLSSSDTGERR